MMEFHEFCEYLKEHVKDYLPNDLKDAEVSLATIQKNNGTELTGLSIRASGKSISPNIYLDNFYQQYRQGMDPDLACEHVAQMHIQNMNPGQALAEAVDHFQDVDFIKSHVVVALVNAQKNEKMLADMPYRLKEDLAIIYKVYIGNDGDSIGTITVKNEHLKAWGITADELHECAMRNSKDLMPVEVQDIGSLLMGMGLDLPVPDLSGGPMLYVISNKQKCNGAAGILYSDCLEKLSEKLGTDLYILPSSVHETLALSAGISEVQILAEMVREVNATQVSPQEQLSDHVYRYDAKAKTITLADVSVKDLNLSFAAENAGERETAKAEAGRSRHHR